MENVNEIQNEVTEAEGKEISKAVEETLVEATKKLVDISEKFDLDQQHLFAQFISMGSELFWLLEQADKIDMDEALEMFDEGATVEEIAEHFEVPPALVFKELDSFFMEEYGVGMAS